MDKIKMGEIRTEGIDNLFLISDIHLGLKLGSEEWIENAREYFEKFFFPLLRSRGNSRSAVLCLGDVFDNRTVINIAANDLAISVFEEMASIMPVYVINGNHDMYNKSDNSIMSLRSLENIRGVRMVKKPTVWTLSPDGGEWERSLLLIPYQDDIELQTAIITQNAGCDYVFLHSDIKSLTYDNGMAISFGVDTSAARGVVYSGHIHKRQETPKMTYVGNPFQQKLSDLGNQKGVYMLNLADGSREFVPNTVSPIFLRIPLEDLEEMDDGDLEAVRHNYLTIQVTKSADSARRLGDFYEKVLAFSPRKVSVEEIVEKGRDINVDYCEGDGGDYSQKTIPEIIDCLIDERDDIDSDTKAELREMSHGYMKLAETD